MVAVDMSDADDRTHGENHPRRNLGGPELSALLKLIAGLGLVTCGGIVSFFFVGAALDSRFNLGGAGIAGGILLGVTLSMWWVYRQIASHLEKFGPSRQRDSIDGES